MRYLLVAGFAAVTLAACGGVSTIGEGHGGKPSVDGGEPPGAGGSIGGKGSGGSHASGGVSYGGKPTPGAGGISHGTGGVSYGTGGDYGTGGIPGNQCKSAAECAVPAVCKVCPGGGSSCATAECVNGQCQTSFPPCPETDAGTGTCNPAFCPSTTASKGCCLSTNNCGLNSGNGCVASCNVDTDCPQIAYPCHVCADGTPSCPIAKCVNHACAGVVQPCPTTGDTWFATCGPPVCSEPPIPTGAPLCDLTKGQVAGKPCSSEGATCDPGGGCSGNLVCAAKDPRPSMNCPVSRAKYKKDIEYLSAEERAKLANDIQSIPLVRYQYKEGPAREHLGFIIEDIEPSPSVDSQHDQVDLYGYTSMAVAALQEQHSEIETLKAEVQSLKAALGRRAVKSGGASRQR